MFNTELKVPTKFLNGNIQYAGGDTDMELRISPETWTGILDLGSISRGVLIKALGVIEILEKEYIKGEGKAPRADSWGAA